MKVFGLAGWSGSGKTTLIEKLIPELRRRGLVVSVIKHAHKGFALDEPGRDSFRHRAAGADEVLLAGPRRWALMHEYGNQSEPPLEACLSRLAACDLVLVEGFKNDAIPKIEVHRPALGRPLMAPGNPWIAAVAADAPVATMLPVLDLNVVAPIAEFLLARLGLME